MRLHGKVFDNGSVTEVAFSVNAIPDVCPLCNTAGELSVITSYFNKDAPGTHEDKRLQVIVQCPRNRCKSMAVAYYRPTSSSYSGYRLDNVLPVNLKPTAFSEHINDISPEFVAIYGQAERAESMNLDRIAGVGYRKSLEFLIKDYLVSENPDDAETIRAKPLSQCINDDVADPNIKSVSERATWLGNDETHYVRKWSGKDVGDLKSLIALSVHWIEAALLTKKLIHEMPDPKAIAKS